MTTFNVITLCLQFTSGQSPAGYEWQVVLGTEWVAVSSDYLTESLRRILCLKTWVTLCSLCLAKIDPPPSPPPQPGLPITATLITGRQWHTDGDLSRTALPAWKRTSKVNMDKKTPAIILNTNGLIFSLTNCRTGVINDAKQSKQNHDYVCFSACLLFSFYSFPVSARNYVGSKYFPIPNDGTSLFLGFGGVNCLDRLDILVFVLLYF